jgi:hypothetical protein
MTDTTTSARFWAKVAIAGPDDCWLWTGSRNGDGYGHFRLDGWVQKAHRVSYAMVNGAIPDGFTIDHLCRNVACVNPAHLEAVTNWENIQRGSGVNGRAYQRPDRCRRGHLYAEHGRLRTEGNAMRCMECQRLHRAGLLSEDGRKIR